MDPTPWPLPNDPCPMTHDPRPITHDLWPMIHDLCPLNNDPIKFYVTDPNWPKLHQIYLFDLTFLRILDPEIARLQKGGQQKTTDYTY